MRKFALFAAITTAGLAPLQAGAVTVVAPAEPVSDTGIVPVYGGCGIYAHRGPYGGCRPGGQAGGYFPGRGCPPGWHVGLYGRRCFPNR